ncbi:MAG: hypothetical protein ACXAE3_07290 [Candidatus Kariarchaeaceae archaeon]|jgi:hypothetical protein
MKRTTVFATLALMLSLMLISHNPVVAQNGQEIFVPDRVEFEHFFDNELGNDIFFVPNQANFLLDHDYTSSESPYDLLTYEGLDRNDLGTFNPITNSFEADQTMTLYHAQNASSLPMDLRYEVTYYDLSGSADGSVLRNVILLDGEMSGFRFDATAGEPLIVDLKIKAQRDVERINLYFISPSGMTYNYGAINDDFATFVSQFVPIIPEESGTYTMFAMPLDNDVIVEQMQIVGEPPMLDIAGGYSERMTGTQTQTIFYALPGGNSSFPSILELSSSIFYNNSVASPDTLLGSLNLRYFSSNGMFGAAVPSVGAAQVIQYGGNATYVAVTATPPHDDDPFITGIKTQLGLPEGYDVEYAFWTERFDIDESFEVDTDITVEAVNSPTDNKFLWMVESPLVVGLNHSAAGTADLLNLNDPESSAFLDSTANNILEVSSHSPTMLQPGTYLVTLTGAGDARIHTMPLSAMELGAETPRVFNVGEPLLFSLPVNVPIKEYFNVTYLDPTTDKNASVNVNFRLYDSEFDQISSTNFLFENYYSNPTTPVFDNFTLIGNTNVNQRYNIDQWYMKIFPVSNTRYNPDGTTNATDDATLNPSFRIERMNYLDVWEGANPDRVFSSGVFSTTAVNSFDINGSKSTYVQVYQFDSANGYNGYRMMFDSYNSSFTVHAIVDWNNFWTSTTINTPDVVNGEDHYLFDFEFGTMQATKFAIVVVINPSLNGTFAATLQQVLVQETPEIELGSIDVGVYDKQVIDTSTETSTETNTNATTTDESPGGDLLTNLLIGGGAVAVIGTVILALRRTGRL